MKRTRRQIRSPAQTGLEAYRRAIRIADEDSLHEVIAREGPAILEMGLPYVLLAARWKLASSLRKDTRQRALLERSKDNMTVPPVSAWDPYERAVRNEQLRILLEVITRLSVERKLSLEDTKIVWAHAEGYTDRQIQSRWAEWELSSPPPSLLTLRKRRQRTLDQIKQALHAKPSQTEVKNRT